MKTGQRLDAGNSLPKEYHISQHALWPCKVKNWLFVKYLDDGNVIKA
jgi:hypothetical protein